jgi:quinohemoprotein ethanol dehydrogenase
MSRSIRRVAGVACLLLAAAGSVAGQAADPAALLRDDADGSNWAAFGRTYGEQHYSPLTDIHRGNVGRLGLAWSLDLPAGNMLSGPLAVDGTLFVATGYSVVRALDAATGRLLWTHDPRAPEAAGRKLRFNWGIRGLAYWNGKVIVGTVDGRLVALDARTGDLRWTVMTADPHDAATITGAPRVFDGKVIIGQSGADFADFRGYVSTYDAETGRLLWRFYTVPGDPAKGFEDAAQAMAAKTWAGEWWKYGGGGNVWNAFTYDAEQDLILLGTGNGAPWNRRIRSRDQGDNLFLCSIVALDAKTGAYRWHYQVNPGETWDYNASMDMQLAELEIDGKPRKVLLHAPKNGFFYVIDRTDGKVVSAGKIAKVTWATHIDLATGRPVEVPGARYPDGTTFLVKPGPMGAHNWLPMAYSPRTGLAYVPTAEMLAYFNDAGIDPKTWKRWPGFAIDGGANADFLVQDADPDNGTSALIAWDPLRQAEAWRVPMPAFWAGGVLATGGDLVFQGAVDRSFNAYDAHSGAKLWSFDAGAPALAPPITYRANGRQYVTVLAGIGTGGSSFGPLLERFKLDYRTMARRVLTFTLDGPAKLPPHVEPVLRPIDDPTFQPDEARAARTAESYGRRCTFCHGIAAVSAGHGPDLRSSRVPQNTTAFASIVRDGALIARGMPRFEELTDAELADLAHYLRTQAAAWRATQPR